MRWGAYTPEVVTDPPPRKVSLRRQFEASERQGDINLPDAAVLQAASATLDQALASGTQTKVRKACLALLELLSDHYKVTQPKLSVLGARPHRVHDGQVSYELFGDYAFDSQRIRVWMRTAVRGKVTSYRGLLNTLLHEYCHHLDTKSLGFEDTPHTRGFYARVDKLYHLALNTPDDKRKPLFWRKRGPVWAVDWPRMNAWKPKPKAPEPWPELPNLEP